MQTDTADLDLLIEKLRIDWGGVGLAVAVVQEAEVSYLQGFGVREVGSPARIDQETLFQVGSTTKAFTAAAIGILKDEQRIQWDDFVCDYLPQFRLKDPWLTRNLTIRDAITHRSGISDSLYPFLSPMSLDATVRHLRHIDADADFRDSYRYSNTMYAVAGKVIEAVSGSTWQEFICRRLFKPLLMDRSRTSPYQFWNSRAVAASIAGSASVPPDLANCSDSNVSLPHGWSEAGFIVPLPWQSYDSAPAAGALISSAKDMANWVSLNMNQGCFGGRRLLSAATLTELHSTQNSRVAPCQFPFQGDHETYAMGWRRATYCGYTHLSHGGGILGFPAYVALMPDPKLGVVVLANGPKRVKDEYTLNKAIAFSIFDRLLRVPVRDWRNEFLSRARTLKDTLREEEHRLNLSRPLEPLPALLLEQYVGDYADELGSSGRVKVRIKNHQLLLEFSGDGAFSATLLHWNSDRFRLLASSCVNDLLGAQFAEFTLGGGGTVNGMRAFGAEFRRVQFLDNSDRQS